VSNVDGESAHQTSALSKEQLEAMKTQIQADGAQVVNIATGKAHALGMSEFKFGKDGIPIEGAGFGGAARITWDGAVHSVEKTGGVLFSVSVNGVKIAHAQPLSSGDVVEVGKSRFTYEI